MRSSGGRRGVLVSSPDALCPAVSFANPPPGRIMTTPGYREQSLQCIKRATTAAWIPLGMRGSLAHKMRRCPLGVRCKGHAAAAERAHHQLGKKASGGGPPSKAISGACPPSKAQEPKRTWQVIATRDSRPPPPLYFSLPQRTLQPTQRYDADQRLRPDSYHRLPAYPLWKRLR